jgi:glycosyltransferase involved in cell wall biosynthesis
VPVLASATTGNRQIVDDGRTGLLYPPNDVTALASILTKATHDPARLRTMGASALGDMATRTHAAMHAARAQKIANALSS